MNFQNKTVAVVGLGKSGFAAAKFLLGKKARVRVTDSSEKKEVLESASYLRQLGAEVETGRHTEEFIADCEMFVVSPGVPKESLPLLFAKKKKIPVISEVELAFYFCRGRIIAVTGSNGKTTTCNLIHHLLIAAGQHSVLCGNVGYSFLDAVAEIESSTFVVLELSSFQLEDSSVFRPEIALVLNISPNHLDRHKTLQNYTEAKEKIFKNQKKSDLLILNHEDSVVRAMAKKSSARILFFGEGLTEGAYREADGIRIKIKGAKTVFLKTAGFKLKGPHNILNVMAAAVVGSYLKISGNVMQKTFDSFETLHHRIEPLGEIGGVRFVNDSKSTTVASTSAAILSLTEPLILIAGGRDKGVSFASIEPLLQERVKTAVLYGEAREKIAAAWGSFGRSKTERFFKDAVKLAFEEAREGDCVLLSPMCTSFDQFSSYEERGEAFKKIFQELKSAWNH